MNKKLLQVIAVGGLGINAIVIVSLNFFEVHAGFVLLGIVGGICGIGAMIYGFRKN